MATLTFGGTTLWNDATGGLRIEQFTVEHARRRFHLIHLPGDNGVVAHDLGGDPESFMLAVPYILGSTAYNTMLNNWSNRTGTVGTLTLASTETRTWNTVLLLGHDEFRGAVKGVAGGVARGVTVMGLFKRLRS